MPDSTVAKALMEVLAYENACPITRHSYDRQRPERFGQRDAIKLYRKYAQIALDYHLGACDRWCSEHELTPFQLDLSRLLQFGVDRARKYTFLNVREDIRLVAMQRIEKVTSEDLYLHTRASVFSAGLRRVRPSQDVEYSGAFCPEFRGS